MQQLTPQGQEIVDNLAQRYGISTNAVTTMLQAIIDGHGTMAQFDHPEFGGSGQWMQGGMTMIGDMFNHALKAKVESLCLDLSRVLAQQPLTVRPASSQSQRQGVQGGYGGVSLFVPGAGAGAGNWWPTELGVPAATGAQNDIRYAFFPATRRLAVEIKGHVTVYDTQDHHISGLAQQQGTDASLTFTSQYGLVRVANLPVVSIDGLPPAQSVQKDEARPMQPASAATEGVREDDILTKIERLAELRRKNIVSAEEFAKKKAELLKRL
jgi:hypothetical protein